MYLLDTHTLLWYLDDSDKLSSELKDLISSEESIYTSIASFWEMTIKSSIGKLTLPDPIEKVMDICADKGFSILPIQAQHLSILHDLKFIHRDPFDRLMISQAKAGNFTIITADADISRYDVNVFWK